MAENSKIEWTHHTGNTWWGCTKVHEGCDNCYAEYLSETRYKNGVWGKGAPRKMIKSTFAKMLTWQAKAADANEIHRVFVGSMMDIFEKPMPLVNSRGEKLEGTTDDLRQKFFNEVVPACPNLMFLLLTKRPSNINKYIPESWKSKQPDNVMYGASVVNQKTFEGVYRHMAKVNGKKFLSVEPLLDGVDMAHYDAARGQYKIEAFDWIIVGGESGSKRRPFNPDWARHIKFDCEQLQVPFFMKQWDKVKEVPGDLMIREFPKYHNTLELI